MKITEILMAEHAVFHNLFDHIEAVAPQLRTLAEVKALAAVVEKVHEPHSKTEDDLFIEPLEHCFDQMGQKETFHAEHENIEGALALFGSTVREKYRASFVDAGAGLAILVNSFGPLSGATFSESFAELVITKTTAQGTQTALVILALCPDGFWRIDGF